MNEKIDRGTLADLVNYRIEKSKKILLEASKLIESELYSGANNRIYYSVFNAINAIHAVHGFFTKTHAKSIGEFNRLYP